MKNFILLLTLFVCFSGFAQELSKRTIENGSELGGDVMLTSSSSVLMGENTLKIFELECPVEGSYFMDAWVMVPLTEVGCMVLIIVNGLTFSKMVYLK